MHAQCPFFFGDASMRAATAARLLAECADPHHFAQCAHGSAYYDSRVTEAATLYRAMIAQDVAQQQQVAAAAAASQSGGSVSAAAAAVTVTTASMTVAMAASYDRLADAVQQLVRAHAYVEALELCVRRADALQRALPASNGPLAASAAAAAVEGQKQQCFRLFEAVVQCLYHRRTVEADAVLLDLQTRALVQPPAAGQPLAKGAQAVTFTLPQIKLEFSSAPLSDAQRWQLWMHALITLGASPAGASGIQADPAVAALLQRRPFCEWFYLVLWQMAGTVAGADAAAATALRDHLFSINSPNLAAFLIGDSVHPTLADKCSVINQLTGYYRRTGRLGEAAQELDKFASSGLSVRPP